MTLAELKKKRQSIIAKAKRTQTNIRELGSSYRFTVELLRKLELKQQSIEAQIEEMERK